MSQRKHGITYVGRVLPTVGFLELKPGAGAVRFKRWRFIVSTPTDDDGGKDFNLSERPALFRRFLEIDDEAAAIAFVRENGPLTWSGWGFSMPGWNMPIWLAFADPKQDDEIARAVREWDSHAFYDAVEVILAHARSMRATWNLWTAVRAGDIARLGSLLRWVRIHGVVCAIPLDDGLWQTATAESPEPYRFNVDTGGPEDVDDVMAKGRNGRLRDGYPSLTDVAGFPSITSSIGPAQRLSDARAWISANLAGALKLNLETDFVWIDDAPSVRLSASCLLAGLWLQMHTAMADGAELRICRACQRSFEVSTTTGRRADAVYCSDACKTRHARGKRARLAERMAELDDAGMDAAQIAKTVGATVAVVEKQLRLSEGKGAKR